MDTMKPQPDDVTIRLPVTFDYHGGRADTKRGNIVVTLVLTIVCIIFMIGVARNHNFEWYIRILICIGITILYTLFLRFVVFKETIYSDAYESLKLLDFKPSTTSYWGIYEVDLNYPYICHFSDGKKGIFIKFEKDVVVGKSETVMYDHFEAISEAYCLAGSLNINIAHIDYMDNVGNDTRMQSLYDDLEDCENPDMKDLMLSVYANLQDEMAHDYTSYDVYLLTTRTKVSQLWYGAQEICDRFLSGNYLTYKVLDSEGIKPIVMSLMNLKDFSVLDACENVLKCDALTKAVVPISVEHGDGSVTKMGKTQDEIKEEERLKEEARNNRRLRRHEKEQKSSVQDYNMQSYDDIMNSFSSSLNDNDVKKNEMSNKELASKISSQVQKKAKEGVSSMDKDVDNDDLFADVTIKEDDLNLF